MGAAALVSAAKAAHAGVMSKSSFGAVVLGGNVFGWTVQQDDAFRILDAFVDRGGTWIDTADIYSEWAPGASGGDSERILGAWLASRGHRDRVHLATKVAKWKQHPGLSAANIRAAIEASLERLQTDYVDLYYAHEDDESVDQAETATAFGALVKEGKVRQLGARAGGAVKYLERPGSAALLATLDELAAAHRVSVAAIALAWLRAQPTVGAPIASARTVEQLGPLFEMVALSADELSALSAGT